MGGRPDDQTSSERSFPWPRRWQLSTYQLRGCTETFRIRLPSGLNYVVVTETVKEKWFIGTFDYISEKSCPVQIFGVAGAVKTAMRSGK